MRGEEGIFTSRISTGLGHVQWEYRVGRQELLYKMRDIGDVQVDIEPHGSKVWIEKIWKEGSKRRGEDMCRSNGRSTIINGF